MALRTKPELKVLFQDGATPSGADFGDIFDTMVAINSGGTYISNGSTPFVVFGATNGYLENGFIGIKTSGGVTKAGVTANGLTFDNTAKYFKIQHYDIPPWDMDTASSATIDISAIVPTKSKVLDVLVKIIADDGSCTSFTGNNRWQMSSDGIVELIRESGGRFDTFVYSSTSSNRGKITVIYDPTL